MIDQLHALAETAGFECVGQAPAEALQVRTEVRDMCAADRCQAYGRTWTCPPACGTLEDFDARIAAHERCVIVQTVGTMEDDFDIEGIMEAEALHKRRFAAFADAARAAAGAAPLLALGAGACTLCAQCTCPDEPCRQPERALTSMEAAGLLVSDVCAAAGIPYNHGRGTIAFTSCVLA